MLALVTAANTPEHIELRDRPEPAPAANEALLEVRAFGVNRGELRLLESRPDGWRPGQDIAGVVARAAEDGSGPKQGERVVALVDQAGWAEMAAAATSRVAVLPNDVSFEAAAALPVAGLTALRGLRLGGMLLGKRVLITGASGGVGQFAVQFAALAGAYVTAVARNERSRSLRELGAHEVVSDIEGLQGTYDVILESVGGASLTATLKLVGADGALIFFGNSSRETSSISFADFGGHPRARVLPFFVYESGPPAFGVDLALMARLIGEGRLKPMVGFEGSWRQLDAALTALRDRQFGGKAVLRID
jgi:NADPH:quinone reductase-like Zn-dependent oxidoreductase